MMWTYLQESRIGESSKNMKYWIIKKSCLKKYHKTKKSKKVTKNRIYIKIKQKQIKIKIDLIAVFYISKKRPL